VPGSNAQTCKDSVHTRQLTHTACCPAMCLAVAAIAVLALNRLARPTGRTCIGAPLPAGRESPAGTWLGIPSDVGRTRVWLAPADMISEDPGPRGGERGGGGGEGGRRTSQTKESRSGGRGSQYMEKQSSHHGALN